MNRAKLLTNHCTVGKAKALAGGETRVLAAASGAVSSPAVKTDCGALTGDSVLEIRAGREPGDRRLVSKGGMTGHLQVKLAPAVAAGGLQRARAAQVFTDGTGTTDAKAVTSNAGAANTQKANTAYQLLFLGFLGSGRTPTWTRRVD